jgi:hypothetical protein
MGDHGRSVGPELASSFHLTTAQSQLCVGGAERLIVLERVLDSDGNMLALPMSAGNAR